MRKTIVLAVLLLGLACTSRAYEYRLQFQGRNAHAVGEQINSDGSVSGQASYFTQSCGRYICGPETWYCVDATWDAQGNLLTSAVVSTAVTQNRAPSPCPVNGSVQYANGTEQVYAASGSSTTGFDTRGYGYIDTPASHYSWVTESGTQANGGYQFIPFSPPSSFEVALVSDGDFPLNITSTIVSVIPSGSATQGTGTATVTATGAANDCLSGPVPPGSTCILTVTFDPGTIRCTASSYGYAYNDLFLALASDAGNLADWKTIFTISGTPGCGDE